MLFSVRERQTADALGGDQYFSPYMIGQSDAKKTNPKRKLSVQAHENRRLFAAATGMSNPPVGPEVPVLVGSIRPAGNASHCTGHCVSPGQRSLNGRDALRDFVLRAESPEPTKNRASCVWPLDGDIR